ncbi:MAG: porin [Alphaproteobacteria bacterium]|nr:porin [Alphaproteobacteria bacterium]
MVGATGWRKLFGLICVCGIATFAGVSAASAQAWWHAAEDGKPDIQHGFLPVPSIATSLPQNGDPAGYRRWLADRGVVFGLEYTNDVLSNVRGGNKTGTIDQGKLQGILTVDFGKLAGWDGLLLFTNFFQIHNTGRIRRDYVGGLNTIAAIEAVPTTRLSEIWLEQRFAGDRASLKVGQLAADTEFFFSDIAGMFLQTDWPTIAAVNLPSGGAAYPLSTPGIRLRVQPFEHVALLFAALNGDPAGPPPPPDEQVRNHYGLNFRVRDPAFIIGEAQFRRNHGKEDTGLATTLKLGGWGHLGQFDDQRFAVGGGLLADPAGSGVAIKHRGDNGLYAIIDQQLYRPKGGDGQSGISVFSRMSISPSDRNLIDAYIDGGIVFADMIPQRPHDRFGASMTYAKFSDSIRAFDRDTALITGMPTPIRDYEANLELTYMAQIVPGWTVQPNLQFIWHPNGDATKNATVVGARSLWRY